MISHDPYSNLTKLLSIKINILLKFQEDWSKSVASKGEQSFKEIRPSDLVFDQTWPISNLTKL